MSKDGTLGHGSLANLLQSSAQADTDVSQNVFLVIPMFISLVASRIIASSYMMYSNGERASLPNSSFNNATFR
jgi:hypothetical protein